MAHGKVAPRATALLAGLAVTATVTACVAGPNQRPAALTAPVALTASTTVLAMAGLGWETVDPAVIRRAMGGYFADEAQYNVIGLPWPGEMAPWNGTLTLGQSVAVGLDTMDASIRDTPGQKVAVGASGATLVADEEMLRLADRLAAGDPTAPKPDEISFVVLGDANRGVFRFFPGMKLPIFDYTVPKSLDTPYNVIVVKGEYDGIGDWPDRWWNLLADVNALAGTGLLQQVIPEDIVNTFKLDAFGSVHYDSMFANLNDIPPENITVTTNKLGGVTTTYLVPTADLPILRPLKPLGVPQDVIDTLEKVLRPIIDSAYVRNDPPATGITPRPGTAAVDAVAVSAPTAAAVRTAAKRPAATLTAAKPAAAKSTAASSSTAGSDTNGTSKATGTGTTKRSSSNSGSRK